MKVDDTLWKDLSDEKISINEKLLIEHFSAKKSKSKKKETSESKTAAPKIVKIVDGKKQQNAGIVISRLKMSTDELRDAVLNMDESKLTSEKVGMLINIAPTGEETGALQGRYSKAKESVHRVMGSTVVSIIMTPPYFNPVSLSLLLISSI